MVYYTPRIVGCIEKSKKQLSSSEFDVLLQRIFRNSTVLCNLKQMYV